MSQGKLFQEKGHYITIDKDVKLIRDHFRLHHLKYADMSPVLIPRGYTKSFLDGNIDHQSQMADIRRAYLNIVRSTTHYDRRGVKNRNSITICEGTGQGGKCCWSGQCEGCCCQMENPPPPILGIVPDRPNLGCPALADVE